MNKIKQCIVKYNENTVGTLALMKDQRVAFSYDEEWLHTGFSINPLSLPLEKKVFVPKMDPFQGLFGVFHDSMPDGWGRLLVDRMLLVKKIDPLSVSILQRLSIVGSSGMGALCYVPEYELSQHHSSFDYDRIAQECSKILSSEYSDDLDALFLMGGSSGGARPKILTTFENDDWIIKFPSFQDEKNIGEIEYRYALCAKQCGIEMSEVMLFPSHLCSGYFGTKRFDRKKNQCGNKKIHMVSVSGLLETTHRIPNLDYHILMKLTWILTNSYTEVEKLYRLMCFNVFAHNRDDHAKNFSYLYDNEKKIWKLAPAYDLTYSNSLGGEHATCIDGNGKNPGLKELLAVAKEAGIKEQHAKEIAEEIYVIVNEHLSDILMKKHI